ncbi:MAG: NAD(P)H-dependent oxidoreductase [Aquamicrobium sp.]|jgi:chromate reductase|uniref:NADPH-dependent FMN reductase n=1 Tax=Mesorhizobium sp. Pch-S TaxID=2082387 RepID=UPI001011EFF6|nr:NADPH-dependent FMN reductase [Mesorhizobium sp. Pch-S]MBR2686868.1 NAD(P)H-dependent oxidoreductase [Aquamicrobium sp.]QAZ46651.1 FMN reductase [Mesorhizobium sp. Pch-S]
MKILAICGSLRARSSNLAVLQAAQMLAPRSLEITLFDGLEALPHFNPDRDTETPPPTVLRLREAIGHADGLLICSPEYARGIAGVMKNALDWLVSSFEFPDKPVAVINASQRSTHADAALRLTLQTMSARLIEDASITLPLLGRNLDAAGIAEDPELSSQVQTALEHMEHVIGDQIAKQQSR